MKHFKEYKQLNLAALSEEVLAEWEKEHLFEKSVETREGHPAGCNHHGKCRGNPAVGSA